MPTHHGTLDELQSAVASAGYAGEWQSKPNDCWRFVSKDRAGLNWSSTKGTIWFDGPSDARVKMQAAVEMAFTTVTGVPTPVPAKNAQTIFVVHGHDAVAREQLELVLHKLGLQPFVLQNTDGGGLTIVESLEKMIGKNAASSFGIVLLTPDDVGYAKKDGETEARPRARQNVILEMGMLLSSLTRERVAILQKGFVEHPSDVAGIIYIPFNEHVKETVPKLAGRLQAVGIKIDGSAIAHASAQSTSANDQQAQQFKNPVTDFCWHRDQPAHALPISRRKPDILCQQSFRDRRPERGDLTTRVLDLIEPWLDRPDSGISMRRPADNAEAAEAADAGIVQSVAGDALSVSMSSRRGMARSGVFDPLPAR